MARTKPTGSAMVGRGDGIDAGAFDPHRAIAEDAAQEALVDPHAFDIGQRDLIGAHGKQAVFLDKAVAGDADLGGPFADHHAQEGEQAQQRTSSATSAVSR